MNIQKLVEALESQGKGAKFISFTYKAKGTGEVARHTIATNVDYIGVCERDITELEIRLQSAKGIEAICLKAQIDSLRESINARNEGREHVDYTKAGQYRQVCPGVKVNLNDQTLELGGFSHAKKVLAEGVYKPKNYRSDETRIKDEIRKSLKVGKFRTYALDVGNAIKLKINGDTIEFDTEENWFNILIAGGG